VETGLARLAVVCSLARGDAALAGKDAASALARAAEAASQASKTGRTLDGIDALLLKARALAATGDASAGATAAAAAVEAGRIGAHDVVVHAAPIAAITLHQAGREAQAEAAAEDLQASIKAIRQDLPPDQLESFLTRGLDAGACREVVALLRKTGKAVEAQALEALLKP
jgi:hypothetical protein